MKKVWSKIAGCLLLCVAATVYAETTTITVNTRNTSLIYKVDDAGKLRQVYFGPILDTESVENTQMTQVDAYPAFGTSYINEAALRVVHGDGNTSTELYFDGVEQNRLGDDMTETVIMLKDGYFPFTVKLFSQSTCFPASKHIFICP